MQDQSVEESNSVCKDCEEKIEKVFNFKSYLVPNLSEKSQNLSDITLNKSSGESSSPKQICNVCNKLVITKTMISLQKVLKDDCIMEVFQSHIPEVVSNSLF